MTNGVLYRYAPMEDTEEAQWVVPKCAVERILYENHDAPIAGHYGVDRTLKRYQINIIGQECAKQLAST